MPNDLFATPLASHPHAALYEACALQDFQEEPLYRALCRVVARSATLLALHDAAPPTQHRAVLLLAALHDAVLADGLHDPDELPAWYASVSGTRQPDDPALPAALQRFAERHAAALRATLAHRHTQTNEIGRCAVLRPLLAELARCSGRTRLALFDFGASAGLNLGVDRYRVRYTQEGRPLALPGASGGEVPELPCRVHGIAPPALTRPPPWTLAARAGCDPLPVDLHDEAQTRWLRACLWPGDAARARRLAQAIALARHEDWQVQAAADGLAVFERWLDGLPGDVQPVLFHSWVLAYFAPDALADFAERARALVRQRGVIWIAAEDGQRTMALSGLVPPQDALPGEARSEPAAHTFWTLTPSSSSGGEPTPALMARSHPHGAWLQWLDGAL